MKRITLILLFALVRCAIGHDMPAQLPEPQSPEEAWTVVEESAGNIDQLMAEKLLRDATFQLANIGTAIQYLSAHANDATAKPLADRLLGATIELIAALRDHEQPFAKTQAQWLDWRKSLTQLESLYPPAMVHSAVYICPMHPLDRHLSPDEKCTKCSMTLVRRRLPASSVYEKPGEPTMTASVIAPPLVAGKPAEVLVRLSKRDGSPVTPEDLLEVHTQKIHLLINDQSLSDYHHEHPKPTDRPGEYAFTFTPNKSGPYRIWADVVPMSSSIQEYVVAEIRAETASQPIADKAPTTQSTVNGRTYTLTLNAGQPIHAGQTAVGIVEIKSADGQPVFLEPIMAAFAHIVGFSEDQKTVLHIHPAGQPPRSPDDRGTPAFAFKFYSPTAGFFRLYVQTQIAGQQQFAPFNVTVLPAEQP